MITETFFDTSAFDWTMSSPALAARHGIPVGRVQYYRAKLGLPLPDPAARWQGADWTKQNAVLAKEFGVTNSCVSAWRKRLKKRKAALHHKYLPESLERGLKRTAKKWAHVEWTKQNCQIAEEEGCTSEYVRQIRVRLGKPKSLNHQKPR